MNRFKKIALAMGFLCSCSVATAEEKQTMSGSPEAIYELYEQTHEDKFKAWEFITCFVSEIETPETIFVDCGKAIVDNVAECKKTFEDCINATVVVAQECQKPMIQSWQAAKSCLRDNSAQ